MKVLLVGDYPPPLGGIAVHVAQLRSRLIREGVPVHVLDIGQGRSARLAAPPGGAAAVDIEGVKGATDFVARLERHAREGHVIHLHTSGNNPKSWTVTGVVGAVARLRNVPAVVTLHSGLLPELLRESVSFRSFARAALTSFTTIIAVSEQVRDALVEAGVGEERILVSPAFVPSEVEPGELPPAKALILSTHRPLLAYAHHPSPLYGRKTFFQALAALRRTVPTATAAVFGPGTNEPGFERDARQAGVSEALIVIGEVPHSEALAVMSQADVFVRPTTVDGDAVSVREALTLGVPCVASDAVRRPEGTCLFRTGDAASLASAVERALALPRRTVPQPDAGGQLLAVYRLLAVASGVSWRDEETTASSAV